MTLSQFAAALDRWGAGLAHWPEAERRAALAVLEHSAEAEAMLVAAIRLETFIHAHDPARTVGDDAVVRVVNSVMATLPTARPARRRTLREWLGLAEAESAWLPRFAVSMAAAALLGLVAGDHLGLDTVQQVSPIEALAMSNTYLPLDLR